MPVLTDAAFIMSDFAGSPGFCAPELLLLSSYDARLTDVWSVACVLLELVHGSDNFNDIWMVRGPVC